MGYIENKLKTFLQEEYGIVLNAPIKINNRLKNTYGNVNVFQCHNGALFVDSIEFHPGILTTNRYDRINNLIKHEAIHYALIKKGGEFRDNDVEFKIELEKHQVGNCDLELKHKVYVYECVKCKEVTNFSLKSISEVKCPKCNTKLESEQIYNNYDGIKKRIKKKNG